jgi:RecJ-like exonuclease|tara:strand:+ start:2468 stop:4135 length:1668 start_codon:yes stop_codon:yes gene_type:complete
MGSKKNNFKNKKGNDKRGFNSGMKKFDRVRFKDPRDVKALSIDEVNKDMLKERVELKGSVERVIQTGGPTIFIVSDGTASLALKGFEKPGDRAYPEIDVDDHVKAVVEVSEYDGELEGEIKNIEKLSEGEKKELAKKIVNLQLERAKVVAPEFLIKSPILDKLRDLYIKAATEIRLAIIQQRPIIVRHHNDTDGYSSGYALERAILPLIQKEHGGEKSAWEFFLRAPCAAPFYEIDDSIRDSANSLRNVAKFSNKMPLVIIADNGSSPEDLMAIKHGKIHGMDFIVIDHHFSDEDVISKEVLTHINPFLIGEDGSHFSAGMLCTEFARFVNPDVQNINQIAGMAGLADRIDIGNKKAVDDYLKIAEKEGYSKDLLHEIASVIDFVSAKIRFMEVREYIEVLFGEPRKKQKELIRLMAPHIRKLSAKGLAIGKSNAKQEMIGKTTLQTIEIEKTFPGFGFYPKPGMSVGMVHDDLQKEKKVTNLVTAGVMNTAITLRATDESNFSVHDLITFINKKSPNSFCEGGGHKNAGSIGFIPNKKDEIVELLKKFIEGRSK